MYNLKIDHVGYLTDNIQKTADQFKLLGYQTSNIVDDHIQKTRICFLINENSCKIELVEPFEDNKTMQKMLSKRGIAPYHLCYVCEDIYQIYDELVDQDWMPLFKPVVASAFDNRLICYFYKSEIGFIEFVNSK